MDTTIILPFEINPILKSLHKIAFPMSIIQGNAKGDITPWLGSRCLNLQMTIDPKKQEITGMKNWGEDLYAVKEGILNKETLSLTLDKYEGLSIDLIDLLKLLISKQCYVISWYDEFFIPGKGPYQRYRNVHDVVLFGFDDSEGVFYSAGYLPSGKYDVLKTPYSCMKRALESLSPNPIGFDILSYREDARFELNVPTVVNSLIAYLFPEDKSGKGCLFGEEEYHGITVMSALSQFYGKRIKEDRFIDSRITRQLMENKYCMYLLAEFLRKRESAYEQLVNRFRKSYEDSTTIHLLGIKLNVTGNADIYPHIDELLRDIIKREQGYVPKMMAALSSLVQ